MKNLLKYDIFMSILMIVFIALIYFEGVGKIQDKWIEKADTIQVLTEMKINGIPTLSYRKVYDGQDYVFKLGFLSGYKLVYVDSLTWFKKSYGDRIFYGYTTIDHSYYRIYKNYDVFKYLYEK